MREQNELDFRRPPEQVTIERSASATSILMNELRLLKGENALPDELRRQLKSATGDDAVLQVTGEDPAERRLRYRFFLGIEKIEEWVAGSYAGETIHTVDVPPEVTIELLRTLGRTHLRAIVHCATHAHWERAKGLGREGRATGSVENLREFLLPRFRRLRRLVQETLNGQAG